MTLDELVKSIPDSEAALRTGLAKWIEEWKRSADLLEALCQLIEKWHGNFWFKETDVSNGFYQRWIEFKTKVIYCIDEMTMNERLVALSLVGFWESANENGRTILRAKINA